MIHALARRVSILLLLAVPAIAQGLGGGQGQASGWVPFREPSEGAYTVDVPQGWRAAGGVRRYAASEAPVWFTAESPDGATELFLGDPSLTTYVLPSPLFAEGSQMPWVHNRPATVMRYRPGAEYAAMYGQRMLPGICQNVQLQGTRPMPQLEDEMRQHVQSATRLDGGEAVFGCQRNGQAMSAAVQAGTGMVLFPGGNGAGFWAVVGLRGFITPAENAAAMEQVLAHVAASMTPDPQFIAAIKQAAAQEEAMAQAQAQARAQAPAPGPVTPYTPRASGPACDDLQQRRLCAINDGRLVVSGGCLTCVPR